MKSFTLGNCVDCPNYVVGIVFERECFSTKQELKRNDNGKIPVWCPLPDVPQQPDPADVEKWCNNCGFYREKNTNFCAHCSADLRCR